jgi:hypothetical protein
LLEIYLQQTTVKSNERIKKPLVYPISSTYSTYSDAGNDVALSLVTKKEAILFGQLLFSQFSIVNGLTYFFLPLAARALANPPVRFLLPL